MTTKPSYQKLLFSSVLCIQAISMVNTYAAQVNLPPTLVLSSPHATLNPQNNDQYNRTPTAADPEGASLTFSIKNKPEWLSFNPSTGAMSGTPSAGDAGSTAGIVVSVTDGVNTVSSAPFTLNVLNDKGQFVLDQCYTESFIGTGGLDDTWKVLASQGFTPTSVVVGQQPRLRLTDTGRTRAGGVSKVFPIPAVGVNQFEFLAAAHGGNGADGIAFVLSDWRVEPSLGVQGHGLGYSSSDTTNGFKGGWLAVGIDEWGNFSDPTRHNGSGGPGRTINSISVRGSGDQLTGYDYLTGTSTLSPSLDGNQTGSLYRITLDSTTKTEAYLTVERDVDPTDNQGYITIIDRFNVLSSSSQSALPEQFRVSFSASTGANTNFHDVTLLTTTGSDCSSVSALKLRSGVVDLSANTATFKVALNANAPSGGISVDYATSDGTALATSEYTAQSGTLNFAQGEREKTITVPLSALDNSDNGKNFFVRLSNSTGAFIAEATNSAELKVSSNNNAPTANIDTFTVDEGRRLNGSSVLSNDTDPENDSLRAILLSNVTNGTLSLNSDGTFIYTHNGSETTSDSFTYRANDGQLNSNTVTVTINVNPINEKPVAVANSYSLNEGSQLNASSVLTNDSDIDGDNLTAILVSNVSNGTLAFNANGTFTYTHNGSETTSDSFTYKANDGTLDSNTVTVALAITPVNDAPVTANDSYTLNEGAQLTGSSVLANDSDAENNNLTATLVSNVSNGTLAFNANGTFTYSHNGSDSTSDSFTYKANDGNSDSNTATVSLNINPINDAPVAVNDSYTVNEGAQLTGSSVLANDIDSDSSNLTASIVSNVKNGTLTFNADGTFTYTHNGGETTSDSFTYKANDGALDSNTVTVTLAITPVNDAPVAVNDSYALNEGAQLAGSSVLANDTDAENSNLTATLVSNASNGTVTLNANGTFTYTHNGSETTSDSFTYKANDGALDSNTVTVSLAITPVNDAPVAVNDSYAVNEGAQLTGTSVLTNDSDAENSSLRATLVGNVTHGTLVFNANGTFTYTHNGSESTSDTFTYKASDGALDSNTVTVTLAITSVNDAPVAANDSYAVNEGAQLTGTSVLANDTDAENSNLTATLVTNVTHGTLVLNANGTFTYTHNGSETTTDSFTYKANDGELDSNTVTVTLAIRPVNDAPVAIADSFNLKQGASLTGSSVLTNDSDAENSNLIATLVTNVSNGTLTLNANGTFTYRHDGSETSSDSFTYKANDGQLDSNPTRVNLNIQAVNKAPIATNLNLTVNEDDRVRLKLAASDPEGKTITYTIVSQPSNGQLTGTAPTLTYTPTSDFNGDDSFTYRVNDGELNSNIATVSIKVIAVDEVNAAPIANNDQFNFSQIGPVTLNVLANDTDPDGDTLNITSANTDFGSATIVDNQIIFTPTDNLSGRFTISYSISDGQGNADSATATVIMDNSQGPVVTLPQDLCGEFVVQANALYTRVDLGEASAVDRFGAPVPVSLIDGVSLFPPGINQVFWSATDAEGNTTIAAQRVCILPLISIEKDQIVLAGNAASVGVYLNGESPVYPLVVPFEVSGSATGNDHDLVNGQITIDSGTEAQIQLNTFVNSSVSGNKTLAIQLDNSLNLGAKNNHQLVITDGNIAPEVSLTVNQESQQRLTVTRTGGTVEISTKLSDPNLQDFHSFTWLPSSDAINNSSDTETKFSFNPENLALGLYQITLNVSDTGTPVLSDSESVYINIVESLADFTDLSADSDNDGIPDAEEGYKDQDGDGIPDYLDRIRECNVLQEQVANQDSYLIEGQPGVCLRRGQLTIGGESGGAEITGQDINRDPADTLITDPQAINVGGIFDYIVYGLPEQGNNYAIVMPQLKPIPADAVYRKYRPNTGWGFFVENTNNSLWSTQGEPGHCPPPALSSENNVWQPGLNEGHWCVQQIIEDGGANDDDGIVNGTIVDPGGVAVMLNSNGLPVAVDDTLTIFVNNNTTINALSNDSDPDGDALTISSAVASIGTVTIENNQLHYQPVRNYLGAITIDYGITDQNGGTDHAVVRINMVQNLAPVVLDEQSEINQGESVSVNLLANDTDPENDALTLTSVDNVNVSFDANGQARFSPPADFFGSMTINYTVSDASGNSSQGQWQVNVVQVHQVAARTEGGGSANLWFLILIAAAYRFRCHLQKRKG